MILNKLCSTIKIKHLQVVFTVVFPPQQIQPQEWSVWCRNKFTITRKFITGSAGDSCNCWCQSDFGYNQKATAEMWPAWEVCLENPLLAKNIIRDQLQFANKHICKDQVCWNNMLGTDTSKIVLFGYSNSKHVWATTKGRFLGEEAQFTCEAWQWLCNSLGLFPCLKDWGVAALDSYVWITAKSA